MLSCWWILAFLPNAAVALLTAWFAVQEFRAPGSLAGTSTLDRAGTFYSRLYSLRGVPLGLGVAGAPALAYLGSGAAPAAGALVAVGAAVQGADIAWLRRHDGSWTTRAVGAIVATAVHLGTAVLLFCLPR